MSNHEFARLVFLTKFDAEDEEEANVRGYRSHVLVETRNGKQYPVAFYEAARLSQDLEESTAQGTPFLAEPGMIVLNEVTRTGMESAARELCAQHFFDHLCSIDADDLAAADPFEWPPKRRAR